MLKLLIIIGLPALCLLYGACVYNPDNEPFTEVSTVLPTEAISLGGFSPDDTILFQLYSKKKFTITSPVSGRKNHEVEIYINNQIVKRIDAITPTFTFEINPTELS